MDLLSDKGEGIVLSFNKYGLTELQYKWSNLQVVNKAQLVTTTAISQEQAKTIYQNAVKKTSDDLADGSTSARIDEPIIRIAYLQVGDEVKPVWVCSSDGSYGDHIFIEMNTGKQLSLS